jgi:hypothetical protein
MSGIGGASVEARQSLAGGAKTQGAHQRIRACTNAACVMRFPVVTFF